MKLKEVLSDKKQEELFKEYRETKDPTIKNKLVEHNLRLVMYVAKRYVFGGVTELDDIFQSGTIGLMRAIEGFDPEKGVFSTYAINWIRQHIIRDLDNTNRVVRIPVGVNQDISELKGIKEKLTDKLERKPTINELSRNSKFSPNRIEELLQIGMSPVSLSTPVGEEDGEITLEDSLADDDPTPEEVTVEQIFIEEFIEKSKELLTDIQYNILFKSSGLGYKKQSIEELAQVYNISTYETTRIQRAAMFRLRESNYLKEISKKASRYRISKGLDPNSDY